MPAFNKFILMGHIVREIEVRYSNNNTAVLSNAVAINSKYKDKETVTFIDFIVFGNLIYIFEKYTAKGSLVLLEALLSFNFNTIQYLG